MCLDGTQIIVPLTFIREIAGCDLPSLYSEHASSQRRHPTQRLGSATIMPWALATKTCRGSSCAAERASAPHKIERGYAQSDGPRTCQKLPSGNNFCG